ncbi:MAG: type II toxin-antitoxin system VapC family toxin [Rhodobacteraceae bacterium]|nr:type II toxin-antitoxin system VapC family toxin [Paracoccaceae bacterium]
MILVDTSAWIEWLIDSATGDRVAEHLPEQADWLVPTMVQLELAKWLTREVGEEKADQVIAFTQVCNVVPLDTEIALAAAEACREHRLATADAIIFATARTRGATVLTCDGHFEGLPGVALIEKIKDSAVPRQRRRSVR